MNGAQVAIVESGRVLVQFRPFPPGWELPGGHCARGEDPKAAAAREVSEETGLEVHIDRLVGVYSWKGLRTAGDALYLAHIEAGRQRRNLEAWSSRLVLPDALPRTTFPWFRQRIADAVAASSGGPPVHREQPVTLYHVAHFASAWLAVPLDRLRAGRHRRT